MLILLAFLPQYLGKNGWPLLYRALLFQLHHQRGVLFLSTASCLVAASVVVVGGLLPGIVALRRHQACPSSVHPPLPLPVPISAACLILFPPLVPAIIALALFAHPDDSRLDKSSGTILPQSGSGGT